MRQIIFLFFFICFFKSNSQVFTYSGGMTSMADVPGGTMLWNVTFHNPSSSPINIQFERYQKYNPPYWFSCFCYIQCNPPTLDTITISIQPFSNTMLTVLFKTDSVNPGTATSSIRIYESGFANNADTVHLNATTASIATGITETKLSTTTVSFPNPVHDFITFCPSLNEAYSLSILDISGKIITEILALNDRKYLLNMQNYSPGEYFGKIKYTSGKTETIKIIKN